MLSRICCVFILLLFFSAVVMLSTSSWIISFCQTFSPPQDVSLCNCDKCVMDYEKGFSEIINKTPEPFLSTKTNISESVFNWWTRLQGERRNFSSYEKTVEKVFQVFPPATKLSKPSPELCRTCAVVGNSGNLKGSHYGPMIDYHDIVIRMNKAPTKGYERDVGTKTTHHVMYPHSATYLNDSTHLLLFPFKTSDLDWLIKRFTMIDEKDKNLGLLANKDLVMILNPAFIQYVHRAWLRKKGMYPSTGFLTVVLSLHMCDEVNVFGFGADRRGNWNHYFERLIKKRLRTGHHPGKIEFRNIQWLRRLEKIQFFSGW